jgi:hypothetical protein
MTEAQAMMKAHDDKMEALLVKYFGPNELARGRQQPDLFFKKQWYCNRINQLGVWEGMNNMRMRRCKYDGKTWRKYQQIENDLQNATAHLILELIEAFQ